MKDLRILFWILCLNVSVFEAYSQHTFQPVDITVSINPFQSKVVVKWSKNPAETGVVAGYLINTWLNGGPAVTPIATVSPSVFEWISPATQIDKSLWYSVGTDYGTAGGGNEYDPIGGETMFLSSSYSERDNILSLNWTEYQGWSSGIDHYEIYYSTVNNQSSFTLLATVINKTSYAHLVNNKTQYYYYVKAVKSGNAAVFSNSNMESYFVNEPVPPADIRVVKLVNNNNVGSTIELFAESSKEYYDLALIRKVDQMVDTLRRYSIAGIFTFTDTWASSSIPSYYFISLDRTKLLFSSSDTVKNITLEANHSDNQISVSWSSPIAIQTPLSYNLDVFIDKRGVNLLSSSTVNYYADDMSYLLDSDKNNLCYRAFTNYAGKYGNIEVVSNTKCINLEPVVWIPTAINPSSTNSENRVFAPRMSLTAPYSITIFNKHREQIFHSKNKGWRGEDNSGKAVYDDTYLYVIEIKYDNDLTRIYKGSVTVVYK